MTATYENFPPSSILSSSIVRSIEYLYRKIKTIDPARLIPYLFLDTLDFMLQNARVLKETTKKRRRRRRRVEEKV